MSAPDRSIIFSREAENDLEAIGRYGYETWGEAQVNRYNARILEMLQSLLIFPRMGAVHGDLAPQVRSIGVGHHRILYRVEAARIIVVRILHERMDEPPEPRPDEDH